MNTMKLWSKTTTNTTERIEQFTVDNDREFDLRMSAFDVEGSIAHVTMLGEQGLMTFDDATTIQGTVFSVDEGLLDEVET